MLKGQPVTLNDAEADIAELEEKLKDLEVNSGIKNYGYKQWVPSTELPVNGAELIMSNKISVGSGLKKGSSAKKPTVSKSDTAEFKEQLAPKQTQIVNEDNDNQEDNLITVKKQPKADKYFGRTPQPYDFGITNTRRFTLVPQGFLKSRFNDDHTSLGTSNTTRLNFITTGINFQLPASSSLPSPPIPKSTASSSIESDEAQRFNLNQCTPENQSSRFASSVRNGGAGEPSLSQVVHIHMNILLVSARFTFDINLLAGSNHHRIYAWLNHSTAGLYA